MKYGSPEDLALLAQKREAYRIVSRARRRGELAPGDCEFLGDDCQGRIEGHHDDYGKPLEIRWLCRRHHMQVHGGRFAPVGSRA